MMLRLTPVGKTVFKAVFTIVLVIAFMFGCVIGHYVYHTFFENQVKVRALKAALEANDKAIELRENKQFEAAEAEKRKKDALSKVAKDADNMSNDDLFYRLKWLCEEHGACATDTPQNTTK
ncbi:MAG: hypothetical protein IJU40_01495 [Desulfovibrionaceae bacterium]|nr:hypothetical protein [Desulfovibrionaceae bacterium]